MDTSHAQVASEPRDISRPAGFVLLVPFALCWLLTLVVPTVRVITNSFQDGQLGRSGDGTSWVGLSNYARLFTEDSFRQALGVTATLTGTRLLVMLTIPLVLGLTIGLCRRRLQMSMRLLFTLPVALFWPVGAALVGQMVFAPQFGLFAGRASETNWFGSPARALTALALSDGMLTFGLACALAVTVGSMLWQPAASSTTVPPHRSRAFAAVWLVAALATVALTLQTVILPLVMTNGGPGRSTATLALLQYQQMFQQMRLGLGSATATVQLLGAGALGLVAALVIIMARLRLTTVASAPPRVAARTNPLAGGALLFSAGVGIVGAVIVGWVLLVSLQTNAAVASGSLFAAPLSLESYERVFEQLPVARIIAATLVPALVAALVQTAVAYMGALGIGGLRPLGRASTWLLLLFSPWLFVTIGPLSIGFYALFADAGLLNSPLALPSPMLCNVPMLFILTLFFQGQERRWRANQAAGGTQSFGRAVVAPSLPLAALLACGSLLVQLHLFLWQSIAVTQPELQTIDTALVTAVTRFQTGYPAQAAALVVFGLPFALFFFILFALFQVFYVERLALVREPAME